MDRPVSAIRFVGGPWHNEVRWVELRWRIDVHVPVQDPFQSSWFWSKDVPFDEPLHRRETYMLCRFVSEGGAPFRQYIHQSLICRDGAPMTEAYIDKTLPIMEFNDLAMFFLARRLRNWKASA